MKERCGGALSGSGAVSVNLRLVLVVLSDGGGALSVKLRLVLIASPAADVSSSVNLLRFGRDGDL